jgi:type I restriction enzyme S subunit
MTKIKLKEITTKIGSGATPRGGQNVYKNSGISLIRSQNVLDFQFSKDGLAYIDEVQAKELDGVTVSEGDILLNITGDSIARCCIVPCEILPARVNQHVSIIRCSDDVSSEYVFYYLQYLKQYLLQICGVGGTRNALTKDVIENLEIKVPSLGDQKKIGSLLKVIDEKIAINNKKIDLLEDNLLNLYSYWFLQFNFSNDQGISNKPYKESGGKLEWNEKIKLSIPVGWDVLPLKDFIHSEKSGDWGDEVETGNHKLKVFCVRGADINGMNGLEISDLPVRYILERNSHKILGEHDIVIEISGGSPTQSTGRMTFITKKTFDRFPNKIICSNFCKAVTLKDNNYFYNFIFFWKALYNSGVFFGHEGKTSGIKNLLFESVVNSCCMPVPPLGLAKKFSQIAENSEEIKQTLIIENKNLVDMRSMLLPLLIEGKVLTH